MWKINTRGARLFDTLEYERFGVLNYYYQLIIDSHRKEMTPPPPPTHTVDTASE